MTELLVASKFAKWPKQPYVSFNSTGSVGHHQLYLLFCPVSGVLETSGCLLWKQSFWLSAVVVSGKQESELEKLWSDEAGLGEGKAGKAFE